MTDETAPRSWAPEVIADSSGKWSRNGVRFATKAEAEASALNLYQRWTVCTDHRATPADEPVNYAWIDGSLRAVEVLPESDAPSQQVAS